MTISEEQLWGTQPLQEEVHLEFSPGMARLFSVFDPDQPQRRVDVRLYIDGGIVMAAVKYPKEYVVTQGGGG
jgi:hypothetical protein